MSNLLVVDDDAEFGDVFAEVLRTAGHEVRVARSGADGLARIAEVRPDVLLCDLDMPDGDGGAVRRALVARNRGDERIPIVLVSADAHLAAAADALGTPYYLEKPVKTAQVLAMIHRIVAPRPR